MNVPPGKVHVARMTSVRPSLTEPAAERNVAGAAQPPGCDGGRGGGPVTGRLGSHLHDAAAEKADGQRRAGYRFWVTACGGQAGETEQEGERVGGDRGGSARTWTPQTEAASSAFSTPPSKGRRRRGAWVGRNAGSPCSCPPISHLLWEPEDPQPGEQPPQGPGRQGPEQSSRQRPRSS